MKNRLSAIDVGTTKVCTVMADANEAGIQILGVGVVPSRGLQRGMVVNLNEARDTIQRSVVMAEQSAGYKIDSPMVSITGRHNGRGLIALIKEVVPGPQEPAPGLRGGELLHGFLAKLRRVPQAADRAYLENMGAEWNVGFHQGGK